MNIRTFQILFSTICSAIAVVILTWWLNYDPTAHFQANVPGMEGKGMAINKREEIIKLGELYQKFDNSYEDR